jgi:hypothetical protein
MVTYPGKKTVSPHEKAYGGLNASAVSVQQTADGGYIVVGGTYPHDTGYAAVLVMKLDSSGEIPGCSIFYTIDVTIMESSLSLAETNLKTQASHVRIIPTKVLVGKSSVIISNPCESAPPASTK